MGDDIQEAIKHFPPPQPDGWVPFAIIASVVTIGAYITLKDVLKERKARKAFNEHMRSRGE